MNFEQHDNLLLADWVFEGSILSASADKEIAALEQLILQSQELASRGLVQAVLWIQKVNCSDFDRAWLDELGSKLLRDEVRWRLARLYRIRKAIQESTIPWFYLSEKSCLGVMAELAFACHRRFVFDTETWFGFPEMAAGQLPALGWLAQQLQRKPKLLDAWQQQNTWKAEEAVQFGLIDAALSWKDWRLVLLPWAQRQVEAWEFESKGRPRNVVKLPQIQKLWADRSGSLLARDHIHSYTARVNRQREAQAGLDLELIDSAARFMCLAPYELWLRRAIDRKHVLPGRLQLELVFFDISESTVPISIVSRLLDGGYRICFFAEKAESLRLHLEQTLGQIETRYHRQALQLFDKQLSWYVGASPRQPLFPTLRFGIFRDIRFQHREVEIRGWALGAQSMERQVAEISEHNADLAFHLAPFFEAIYSVKAPSPTIPLLYLTRSLALQLLVRFCQTTGESMASLLEQLRNLDWKLLGSERHWQKFLSYRIGLQTLSQIAIPEAIGRFDLDRDCLHLKDWKSVLELSAHKTSGAYRKGPGWLHNYISSLAIDLSYELFRLNWVSSLEEADMYVADALAFPSAWGSPLLYARRMGQRRRFYDPDTAEVAFFS